MASVQTFEEEVMFEEAVRKVREILSKHGVECDPAVWEVRFEGPGSPLKGYVTTMPPTEEVDALVFSMSWPGSDGIYVSFNPENDDPWDYDFYERGTIPKSATELIEEFSLIRASKGLEEILDDPHYLDEATALRLIDRMVALCMTPPTTK